MRFEVQPMIMKTDVLLRDFLCLIKFINHFQKTSASIFRVELR